MAQRSQGPNKFAIIISIVIVAVVVGVGVLVVNMNNAATTPAEAPAAASINDETGAISVGDGPNVISEYVDFMCPFCGDYWNAYSGDISAAIEAGQATLEIHPISILDNSSQGTQYSTRSASAAYCVAESNPDALYTFVDLMYMNQPSQATSGLEDDQIAGFAEQAGAPDAASCIANAEYAEFVAQQTEQTPVAPGAAGVSTPTVLVNGDFITVTGDPQADIISRLTD